MESIFLQQPSRALLNGSVFMSGTFVEFKSHVQNCGGGEHASQVIIKNSVLNLIKLIIMENKKRAFDLTKYFAVKRRAEAVDPVDVRRSEEEMEIEFATDGGDYEVIV